MVEGASKLFVDVLQKMHDPRDLALKCLLASQWLSLCSQTNSKMIKDLYFISSL
jgi:hypothetical protein